MNYIKRALRVRIFKLWIGTWIALICSVTGIALALSKLTHGVTLGGGLIILGLAVSSITGKRERTKEKNEAKGK